MFDRSPILVTGIPRSGTSWVGKMLEASRACVYINEPLNPRHPPGGSPGVLNADVCHRFQYIDEPNEQSYLQPFRDTLALKYHVISELRANRSPSDLLRMLKNWTAFTEGRIRRKRPLVDDPYAAFSCEWFARRLGCDVVVVVRHPAAVAASRKRLGWRIDLADLLDQRELLTRRVAPFRTDLERLHATDHDVVAETALLWRMIYATAHDVANRNENVHIVRNEDLSLHPVDRYRQLYETVGLHFDARAHAAVVRSTTGPDRRQAHTWSISKGGISRTGYRRLDSKANVSLWTKLLTPAEIASVRLATADVASLFYSEEDWDIPRARE